MKSRKTILLILLLCLHSQATHHVASSPTTDAIDIDLYSLDGSELTPRVYTSGTTLTITYVISQQVDSAAITLTGSGYSDTEVPLEYMRVVTGGFAYAIDITITSYTTFSASATLDSNTVTETISSNVLGLTYHRVWTSDDRSPQFLSVNGTSIDQLEDVDDYQGSSVVNIQYQSVTQDPSDVYLVWGSSPTLGSESLMTEVEPNIYEINITRPERELWFTAKNINSFEYNADDSTSYNHHRVTNGIAITSLDFYTIRDGKAYESITNLDSIFFNVTTRNETGSENLSINSIYDGDALIPKLMQTTSFSENASSFITYSYNLTSALDAGESVRVTIQLVDDSTGQLIATHQSHTTIIQYGATVVFDDYPPFTNKEVVSVDYIINDPPGRGLKSVELTVNNQTSALSPSLRSTNVSLVQGENTISLEVTNGVNQTTNNSITIMYDITDPEVSSAELQQSPTHNLHYTYRVALSDAGVNDSGLDLVYLTVNNSTQQIEIQSGSPNVTVEEKIALRTGQNVITIEVYDRAGNLVESTTTQIIALPSSDNSLPTAILPAIVGLLVVTYSSMRRKS